VATLIGNIVAWTAVGLLALWLLVDFTRTNMKYDEEYLTTSHEGVDEFAEVERAIAGSESATEPPRTQSRNQR
jgi:hypothetical protein